MPGVWNSVCEKYPSIIPEKYLIDDSTNGSDYAKNDEDLFALIAERIEVDSIKDFEELNIYLDLYNEDNPDNGIYYHEFTTPVA